MPSFTSPSEAGSSDSSPLRRVSVIESAPLYEVVKRQISEAIVMGTWPPGTVLPSEVSMAKDMRVAVGTIRRALLDLAAEGLLTRRRKTGTVVTGRTPHHGLRAFFQYFRLNASDGSLVTSTAKVLSVEIGVADENIRKWLELPAGSRVMHLRRLRIVDKEPVMIDHFIVSADRIPDFPLVPEQVPQLVYVYLLDRYGIRISAVREQVSAELASDEDMELLGLTGPAAILKIEEMAYDQSGTPTIYGIRRATTRNHVYTNEVR